MCNQVIEGCEIMIHVGFQDKVLTSGIPFASSLCHFIQRGLKQIDLPSDEINCFLVFILFATEKSCNAGKMFTHMSSFPVIDTQLNAFFFFLIPEGFLIRCNTLLTSDKMNFISAISGRCNQHIICLSAQNYHFC